MKNLIVVIALLFAVGINAQTKTNTNAVKTKEVKTVAVSQEQATAKKIVNQVSNIFPIDKETKVSLEKILVSKYETLNNSKDLSPERLSALSQSTSAQIENVLGKETFDKIKRDPDLYQLLVK